MSDEKRLVNRVAALVCGQLAQESRIAALAENPKELARLVVALESGSVPAGAAQGSVEAGGQRPEPALPVAQLLTDLLAIVAAQQVRLDELSEELTRVRGESLEVRFQKNAVDDIKRLVDAAIDGVRHEIEGYEVSLPGFLMDIEFSERRSEAQQRSESSSSTGETRAEVEADVGVELKGLAAKLAGLKADVKVDTTRLDKRAEVLAAKRSSRSSAAFSGKTRIDFRGASVKKSRR